MGKSHDVVYYTKNILRHCTQGLFWNFDKEKIDFLRDKDAIIKRIIEAGLQNDEILMWKLYSYNDIKKVAVNMDYMESDRLAYMAFVLKINEEQFKCYGKRSWYQKY